MLRGFEHVQFTCSNMDRTLQFYCDLIGFQRIVRRTMEGGSEIAFIECNGGAQLEIVQPAGDVAGPTRAVPRSEAGIKHFALNVDSVDAIYDRLHGAGFEFSAVPREATFKTLLNRLCVVRDPDDVHVEFNERAPGRPKSPGVGFEHVNITCSDLERTLHFYRDLVGFRLVHRQDMPTGGEIAFLECEGGQQVEVVRPAGDVETPARAIPRSEVGIKHFALVVDNVDDMHARLRSSLSNGHPAAQAEVKIASVDHVLLAMPEGKAIEARTRFFVHDPFGNRIESRERD
jgi:glyoxylase I family protein